MDLDHRLIVLNATARIDASTVLGRSRRQRALLAYLVEEELAGRGPEIKAARIAIDVFERGSDFDPQTDSIVRVEVARLRKSLELYAATDGRADDIEISIPTGSYRPVFIDKAGHSASSADRAPMAIAADTAPLRKWTLVSLYRRPIQIAVIMVAVVALTTFVIGAINVARSRAPIVIVNPVVVTGSRPELDFVGSGLASDVAAKLARFGWIDVRLGPDPPQSQAARPTPLSDYALHTVLRINSETIALRATLMSQQRRIIEWSADYSASLRDGSLGVVALTDELARQIASDVGRPLGAVLQSEVDRIAEDRSLLDPEYLCYLRFNAFLRKMSRALHQDAQTCLTEAVARNPSFTVGQAALAILELETFRLGLTAEQADALLLGARRKSRLASQQDPEQMITLIAAMHVAACSGEDDQARTHARTLTKRYPLWPTVTSDVGLTLAMALGDWEQGLKFAQSALRENSAPEPWYPAAPAMRSILDGNPRAAVVTLAAVPQHSYARGHLIRLVAANLARDTAERDAAARSLTDLGYPDLASRRALVRSSCWSQTVRDTLIKGLEAN